MWVDDDDIEEMVLDKDNDDGDEFEYEDLWIYTEQYYYWYENRVIIDLNTGSC
jgi:uncharacterized protein (DUF779 family)